MYSFGQSNTSLRAWVRQRFAPTVMVVTSEGVEDMCQGKNGLAFVDILRPFADQPGLNAPIRVAETNIRITECRLRFCYASSMEQPTAEVIDAHLMDVVKRNSIDDLPDQFDQITPRSTPWFLAYREEFMKLLCFDAHETLDHPLGVIYAVSSSEPDSIKAFEDLEEGAPLPTLMLQQYMAQITGEESGKLYVVVHDGSKEGQTGLELAREKVRIVQKEYGAEKCQLLLINTSGGRQEMVGVPPVPFEKPKPVVGGGAGEHILNDTISTEDLGSYLSKADLERVSDLVRGYLTRCFFPKLDLLVSRLRTTAALKKRSLASRFMERTSSMFKSGLASVGRDPAAVFGFRSYTDEAQMRRLGDIYFLLGRYEDALEVFTSISVSKDGYPRFYAGLQFMVGLCYSMLAGFADPSIYFSRSYDFYLKTPGKTARMQATRSAMIHSAYCVSEGDMLQAAKVLLKGYDTEETLRGALLLEQSALLLLAARPPSLRKFAFNMTLAGVWFYNCALHNLSLRSYTLILDVYKNRHWEKIDHHVAAMMLKFHRDQGNDAAAFEWTMNMLTSGHSLSVEVQREYVDWVCSYMESLPKTEVSSITNFSLPAIHLDSMRVEFDGERVNCTAEAGLMDSSVWDELESLFVDAMSASVGTGLALASTASAQEASSLVVCGEAVRLTCIFENPLQTKIDVTSCQLLYEFERTDDSRGTMSTPVAVPETSFSLMDSERRSVQLEVVPMTSGKLRIIGVSWFLNGLIPGHRFIGDITWRDGGRLPFRAKSNSPTLLFMSVEPVPRMVVSLADRPHKLLKGEIWRGIWSLRNAGKVPFKNLQVATGSPNMSFSSAGDLVKRGKSVYQLEEDPSEEVQLGVSINPQSVGPMQINTVIKYDSPAADAPLKSRFLRIAFEVEVEEALHLKSWLLPSDHKESFILAVELDNQSKEASFVVRDVKSCTKGFEVSLPGGKSPRVDTTISPDQKFLKHFLVEDNSVDHVESFKAAISWKLEGKECEGELNCVHDLSSISDHVELTLDRSTMSQSLQNGFTVFPLRIQLRNISSDRISVMFKAGDDLEGRSGWRSGVEEGETSKAAGLSPISSWTWSGQTECIADLMPGCSTTVESEIVAFFAGNLAVSDYSCQWRSLVDSSLIGTVLGRPIYLNVT